MMVHVDAVGSGLGEQSRCEARSRSNCQCGGTPGKQLSAAYRRRSERHHAAVTTRGQPMFG